MDLKYCSSEHEVPSSEHEKWSSEHKVPSSEHEVPSSEHEVPSSEHEVPSSEHEKWSSEHKVPSSEHEVPSSEHEKWSSKSQHWRLYQVRLISCNSWIYASSLKTLPPAPCPLLPCGLNDKSLTEHDIRGLFLLFSSH